MAEEYKHYEDDRVRFMYPRKWKVKRGTITYFIIRDRTFHILVTIADAELMQGKALQLRTPQWPPGRYGEIWKDFHFGDRNGIANSTIEETNGVISVKALEFLTGGPDVYILFEIVGFYDFEFSDYEWFVREFQLKNA